MSKVVLVCLRSPDAPSVESTRLRMKRFLETLRPDNLPHAPTVIHDDGRGLCLGVLNPAATDSVRDCSAYAGWLADRRDTWWQPGTLTPNGSFALFRSDPDQVEVLADYAGSRTIWVAKTDSVFIASTSQRAIPWFLESFELNSHAVLWMLSAGSLPPAESWDRRIQALGPNARAHLDRRRWHLDLEQPPVTLRTDQSGYDVHKARLDKALQESCGEMGLDWSQWVLPLSGGHDSRAILLRVRDKRRVRCVTWGLREALDTPGTDAFVARKLAAHLGLSHQYFETDLSDEPVERVLQRFLTAGEGRVDHIAGYMDGFRLWNKLVEAGVKGIVRGDHAFGRHRVSTVSEVRSVAGMNLWSHYGGLLTLRELGLEHLGEQSIPPWLEQQPGESLPDWRERAIHAFRIPAVSGALNELKSAYVEIANPLLTRPLIELARSQPDSLRTGKKLFRDVAVERVPVDYADEPAIARPEDALALPAVTELLLDEISSARTREILSRDFSSFVAGKLQQPATSQRASPRTAALKRAVKRWLPKRVHGAFARNPVTPTPSARQLALRAFLIGRMVERLQKDAHSID